MKTTKFLSLIFLFSLFLFAGCSEENNNVDPRLNLVGKWTCFDKPDTAKDSYKVNITLNTSAEDQVFLLNFGGLGNSFRVYGVVSNDRITIPLQDIGTSGWSANGSGTIIKDKKIEWRYTLENGALRIDLIAVFTKDN